MTAKKSEKKTTSQTISTSMALKNRIRKYLDENHEKFPEDKRFSSVSAFYNHIMEKSLDIFEKGKTLDDFDRVMDGEIEDYFDQISFKAIIPFFEIALETNRYSRINFQNYALFLSVIRNLWFKIVDVNDINSLKLFAERIKNEYLSQKINRELNIDIFTGKNKRDIRGIWEYVGISKNLFFENCKVNAALCGVLGLKISDFLCSEDEFYSRFDFKPIDLFFRKDLVEEELDKVINHNVDFLINFLRIINDKDYYSWMRMAEDKNLFINFNSIKAINNWINLIEKDLNKYGTKENFLLNILKFFEKLHWIDIENEKGLVFQIRLNRVEFNREKKFLLDYLSKKSKISKIDDDEKYFLEEK